MVTISPSVHELWCYGQKNVSVEHCDVTVKLTFGYKMSQFNHFILIDLSLLVYEFLRYGQKDILRGQSELDLHPLTMKF